MGGKRRSDGFALSLNMAEQGTRRDAKRLARIIHDGSSRNRAVAKRDERRGRPPAHRKSVCRLVAAANSRLQ